MPRRLHMTVPSDFRRNAATPEILILLAALASDCAVEADVNRVFEAVAAFLSKGNMLE
jgi:hypothetical protein